MKTIQRNDKKRHSTNSLYRNSITITELPLNVTQKNDILAERILKTVKSLSLEQRIAKAERHLYDAYYLRTIRNDIDEEGKKYLKILWSIENHSLWIHFQLLMTVVYQVITLFEPSDTNGAEGFVLAFLGVDVIITIVLLATKKDQGFKFNLKRQLKIFLYYFCLFDFFIHLGDPSVVRFSRICRTLLMPMFSKDLRRTLKGMMKASKDLVLLIVIYLVIISIFAFVGINLIGTLDNVDNKTQDYGNFLKFFSMLFFTSTLDFYPDILIPPMLAGTFYCLFFILYLLLYLFLFQPIPLAVVYEGFRSHRTEIAISDIIKQKSAMLASFISLDIEENGFLSETQFKNFISGFYKNQLSETKLKELLQEIDKDFKQIFDQISDKVQFDEFYQLINVLQEGVRFQIPRTRPWEWWENFRAFFNSRGLKEFAEGNVSNNLMLVITILNCILIIVAFFIDDTAVLDVFNTLDTVFLVLYGIDILIKIIALGMYDFFDDGWNIFDLSLVILQICFDYILFNVVSGNISQSIKANRILRLAKIQKVFRLFRAFRSIKVISFLLRGVEFLDRVRKLIYKILFCIPLIFRLLMPVQMVFFIYSSIGNYMYGNVVPNPDNPYRNNACSPDEVQYQWGQCQYAANFYSFSGSYLLMLQMFIAAQWSQTVFEITHDTGDMTSAMFFIGSFEFISIFLLSLICGLVWEVFTIVTLSLKQEDMINEEQVQSQDEAQIDTKMNFKSQLSKLTLIFKDDKPDEVIIFQSNDKREIHEQSPKIMKSEQGILETLNEQNCITREDSQVRILQVAHSKAYIKRKSIPKVIIDFAQFYRSHFTDYKSFLENKRQEANLDLEQVTIEYMNHLRNEIKKDEVFQKKYINISNHHLLIQNAVLRDTPEVYIKQQEEDYFKISFGDKFERIKELKFQSKFKIESKILFSLMGILKFPKPNIKYYFQILYLIENYFTYQLLPDSSFFKLIHQINNKWYAISIQGTQTIFNKIDNGPWDYADALFDNSNMRICENLRSLLEDDSIEYRRIVDDFTLSLNNLGKNFEMDVTNIDVNSTCILYQIQNELYVSDSSGSIKLKRNNGELSPDHKYVIVESQRNIGTQKEIPLRQDSFGFSEHQHVSRTIMFVLAKRQAQEKRIIYQNHVMLAQFVLDLAGVINNYSHNFFQQLEDLYILRLKQKGKGLKRM